MTTENMTENCNTGEHVRDSLTSTDDLSTTKEAIEDNLYDST